MSAICGWSGPGDPTWLSAMLDANDYRGDRTATAIGPAGAVGYRWWGGRPGKSPDLHRDADGTICACAGALTPRVDSPAAELTRRLRDGRFDDLDGTFAAARLHPDGTLELIRDPFGVRSLYWVRHRGCVLFATELKQLLAVPDLPVELDPGAVHRYLTFSFVPGDAVPIAGVSRVSPGQVSTFRPTADAPAARPWFTLTEAVAPIEQGPAAQLVWKRGRGAVSRRLLGEPRVGLYLSGGLDSSAVGVWLADLGANVQAFTLDFGADSVEREEAEVVARHLGFPLERVAVDPAELGRRLPELAWTLDLPFGDPVTGPHWMLGRAARAAGLGAVFNGEGGDQLFGGWTSKPMVAASVYGDGYGSESPEQQYLRSYHRFYGLEDQLYTPAFAASVGPAGQRRALVSQHLGGDSARTVLNRIRLTDIALKGSQNILPRAERMANAHALDVRVPLFDRRLAEASFTLPPSLKLHGACEKYVLKLAMQHRLPEDIVWRRKYGMSVPITDWVRPGGPLADVIEAHLGDAAVRRRGLFRPEYVAALRSGQDHPSEVRRRRVGEKLWTLLALEAWMRVFVDGRGRRP
jgi:asparagine synthase (glutamine-hydrolysing)